jgi:hypothetical protein
LYAELDRFQDAPALAVGGEHDDGNVRRREGSGRAHDVNQVRAVEQRHFPIQHDHVGREVTGHFQRGDTVTGLQHSPNADIAQHAVRQIVHERIVIDHEHAQLLNHGFDVLGADVDVHEQQVSAVPQTSPGR